MANKLIHYSGEQSSSFPGSCHRFLHPLSFSSLSPLSSFRLFIPGLCYLSPVLLQLSERAIFYLAPSPLPVVYTSLPTYFCHSLPPFFFFTRFLSILRKTFWCYWYESSAINFLYVLLRVVFFSGCKRVLNRIHGNLISSVTDLINCFQFDL